MSLIPLTDNGRDRSEMTNRILTVKEYADRMNGRSPGAGRFFSGQGIPDSHHKCLLETFNDSLPVSIRVLKKSGQALRSFFSQGDMYANT